MFYHLPNPIIYAFLVRLCYFLMEHCVRKQCFMFYHFLTQFHVPRIKLRLIIGTPFCHGTTMFYVLCFTIFWLDTPCLWAMVMLFLIEPSVMRQCFMFYHLPDPILYTSLHLHTDSILQQWFMFYVLPFAIWKSQFILSQAWS